jgi:hypothetical protein
MKTQDTLGAGLVVVGIALLNSNKFIGMLFIGFGLGYNLRPIMQKAFFKKWGKKKEKKK